MKKIGVLSLALLLLVGGGALFGSVWSDIGGSITSIGNTGKPPPKMPNLMETETDEIDVSEQGLTSSENDFWTHTFPGGTKITLG